MPEANQKNMGNVFATLTIINQSSIAPTKFEPNMG